MKEHPTYLINSTIFCNYLHVNKDNPDLKNISTNIVVNHLKRKVHLMHKSYIKNNALNNIKNTNTTSHKINNGLNQISIEKEDESKGQRRKPLEKTKVTFYGLNAKNQKVNMKLTNIDRIGNVIRGINSKLKNSNLTIILPVFNESRIQQPKFSLNITSTKSNQTNILQSNQTSQFIKNSSDIIQQQINSTDTNTNNSTKNFHIPSFNSTQNNSTNSTNSTFSNILIHTLNQAINAAEKIVKKEVQVIEVCSKCLELDDFLKLLTKEVLNIKNDIKSTFDTKLNQQTFLMKFAYWVTKTNLLRADIFKLNDLLETLKTSNCAGQEDNSKKLLLLSNASDHLVEIIQSLGKKEDLNLKVAALS